MLYACLDDGNENPESFAIVMEDLTVHSRVFDQVYDPPDESFARKLAHEAASLHAHYWESDVTKLGWLCRPDGRYVFSLDAMSRSSASNLAEFRTLWRKVYGQELFDELHFGEARRLVELLCGPTCELILDRIYDILSSRPKTLLHGDMRANNLFRADPALGASVEESQLTFIDWQIMHIGPPGPELTQAWMHSLEPEVRRMDSVLLREYWVRLTDLNPAAATYTYEMLVEDYSLGCCFWLTALISIGVATLGTLDETGGVRMKQLWYKAITRALTAVTELSCLARIQSIAEGASR